MSCASRAIRRRPGRAVAPALLLILAAGLGGARAVGSAPRYALDEPGQPLPLLTAARYYRADQYQQAAAEAEWLLSGRLIPCQPRALLVLAAARQAQGRYEDARDAWDQALPLCGEPRLRQYVLDQIALCERGGPARDLPSPPSARLTREQRDAMATVDLDEYVESGTHFTVHSRNADLSRAVLDQAQSALARISRMVLGPTEYPHSVEIHVHPTAADYAAHAPSQPGSKGSFELTRMEGGYMRRVIHLTQLDEHGRLNTDLLDRVLPHELTHLVVTEWFGDAHCPLYLHEGLAMLAEYGEQTSRTLLAGAAVATGQALPLEYLLTRQSYDPAETTLLYAQSYSLLRYIQANLSEPQFRALLLHIRDGSTLADALHRALAIPHEPDLLAQLEQAWRKEAVAQAHILSLLRGADGRAL